MLLKARTCDYNWSYTVKNTCGTDGELRQLRVEPIYYSRQPSRNCGPQRPWTILRCLRYYVSIPRSQLRLCQKTQTIDSTNLGSHEECPSASSASKRSTRNQFLIATRTRNCPRPLLVCTSPLCLVFRCEKDTYSLVQYLGSSSPGRASPRIPISAR